jgi:hypothetical protein
VWVWVCNRVKHTHTHPPTPTHTHTLKGFINFTHPFDLPDMCETKRLTIIPRNPKFIVEEKRAPISVQMDYAEAPIEQK